MSTPAGSNVLLKNKTNGAFIFSASHNPGGIDNDFGVKYSDETGGQVPTSITDAIYRNSQTISEYKILEAPDIDLGKIGVQKLENMTIEVIDPIKDYVEMLEGIFDFEALKSFSNPVLP